MKRILLALMAFAALGLVGIATVQLIDVAVVDSGVGFFSKATSRSFCC